MLKPYDVEPADVAETSVTEAMPKRSPRSSRKPKTKKLFVLDTNVLMHDPTCLFRFQEHDLYVPMMVLEELDHNKKGRSEVARNARQASRFMDEIMSNMSQEQIEQGLLLNIHVHDSPNGHVDNEKLMGRLFFQTVSYRNTLPEYLPGNLPDNNILGTTLALKNEFAITTTRSWKM